MNKSIKMKHTQIFELLFFSIIIKLTKLLHKIFFIYMCIIAPLITVNNTQCVLDLGGSVVRDKCIIINTTQTTWIDADYQCRSKGYMG